MRTEEEMMRLIMETAKKDKRICAVYMNGSRTNVHAIKDIFQDYDIVYVVKETKTFREDAAWIDRFGERLYMQCPEQMDVLLGKEEDCEHCYGWLMQFADGNRLDLHVQTVAYASKAILQDKLCKILLDKEGILPEIPEATDEDYWIQKPDEIKFSCIANEFWWCLNSVAKGLFRKEVPYVQDMMNYHVRPQLVKMLSWKIGILCGYSLSIGKSGKYMYRFLPDEDWKKFLSTYAGADIEELWQAVFEMCALFQETAEFVSEYFAFLYNQMEADHSLAFLQRVRNLPMDAAEV